MQKKKDIKNNIKKGSSVGREKHYCQTADRFCNKLSRKKSKSKPWKFTSFSSHLHVSLLNSNSANKYHSVRDVSSSKRTISMTVP